MRQQALDVPGLEPGKIAGRDENGRRAGCDERGIDSIHGSAFGIKIEDHVHSQESIGREVEDDVSFRKNSSE
jgi:hypothetical protein